MKASKNCQTQRERKRHFSKSEKSKKKNALEIEGKSVQKQNKTKKQILCLHLEGKYFHLKNYDSLKQNINKTYIETNKENKNYKITNHFKAKQAKKVNMSYIKILYLWRRLFTKLGINKQ